MIKPIKPYPTSIKQRAGRARGEDGTGMCLPQPKKKTTEKPSAKTQYHPHQQYRDTKRYSGQKAKPRGV